MQRLHVVGFTTDHEGLILSARRNAKSGGYMVIADADLEEALVELRRARGGEDEDGNRAPRPESTLTVREMQQRLRAGQTISEVAEVAGVAEEWIARFAIPIQAEQSLVVQRALELVMNKQRVGPSSQPLGTSVWWNLQDRGAKVSEDEWSEGWSAFLKTDQVWVVQFSYEFRRKQQVAEWEVDLRTGVLHTRNRLGTDLGYVESGRRRRPGPPKPIPGGLVSRPAPAAPEPDEPAPKKAAKNQGTKKTTAKKPAAKKPAARKSSAKKSSAKKPAARRSTAKKSATKSAATKKAATKKAAAKTAARRSGPRKAAAKKSAARRAPAKKTAKRGGARRSTGRKAAAKRPAAKKARPAAANQTQPTSTRDRARAVIPAATTQPRATTLIAGAARAGGAVITPAPAPQVARTRPTDHDGRPVRRREPLRAR